VADEDRVRVEGRAVALAHVDAHQVVEQLESTFLRRPSRRFVSGCVATPTSGTFWK